MSISFYRFLLTSIRVLGKMGIKEGGNYDIQ